MTWPLNQNKTDACTRCRRVLPVAANPSKPGADEIGHYQPDFSDPEQYICGKCRKELEGSGARVSVRG